MELFKRRPLSFFCLLFLLVSLFASKMDAFSKAFLILILFGCLSVICVLLAFKEIRVKLLYVLISLAFIFSAALLSYLRIDVPQKKAEEYLGWKNVEMSVLSREYNSEYTSTYTVRVNKADGAEISCDALLVMAFESDLNVGDVIKSDAELTYMGDMALGMTGRDRSHDPSLNIMAVIYETDDCYTSRFNENATLLDMLASANGRRVLTYKMRSFVADTLSERLGQDVGALATGFLIGDTSDIPTSQMRDFRRSGISHLLAVSGVHISVLLGALELLLKKIRCPKLARLAAVSIGACILLALTGYAMSAVRSVFMLWCFYLSFLLSEDDDSITSLFVSVTVILIIFPYGVYDLGLWMSFLATLGLVTVFTLIDRAIPRKVRGKKLVRRAWRITRSLIMAGAMTLVANSFLMIISWYVFGEISLVSIPVNMLVTPLGTAFLIFIALVLAFGGLPVAGDLLAVATKGIYWLITFIARSFSGLNGASVSLKYSFAGYLTVAFAIAIAVMLVVKIKRKWLLALPPICFALSFSVCLVIYNALSPKTLTYHGYERNETLSIVDDGEFAIVDMSAGYNSYFNLSLQYAAKLGATDIDTIVLTRVNATHLSAIDMLLRNEVVHHIYVPVPSDSAEYERAIELVKLAQKGGTEAYLYDSGENRNILSRVSARIFLPSLEEPKGTAALFSGGEFLIGYTDARLENEAVKDQLEQCDTVLIGGNSLPKNKFLLEVKEKALIICADSELYDWIEISGSENIYALTENKKQVKIKLN